MGILIYYYFKNSLIHHPLSQKKTDIFGAGLGELPIGQIEIATPMVRMKFLGNDCL